MPPPLAASMTNPRSGQHQASCIAGKGQHDFLAKEKLGGRYKCTFSFPAQATVVFFKSGKRIGNNVNS
jgi:hypothetical protein